jgi:hypothetical protein
MLDVLLTRVTVRVKNSDITILFSLKLLSLVFNSLLQRLANRPCVRRNSSSHSRLSHSSPSPEAWTKIPTEDVMDVPALIPISPRAEYYSRLYVIVVSTLYFLSLIVVPARLGTRYKFNTKLWADDWFIAASFVSRQILLGLSEERASLTV